MDKKPLQLWGGVECTVNRVGDTFFDQTKRNGHAAREDDLERFAALGLKALRYPVLWETLAPETPAVADWSWPDRRLGRLRELGIRPIVGLVHHGSGPRRTNLLDPGFAEGLADFARQVAERYPWVEDFTPVNEPLTTARFSALYGHWYPHTHDTPNFARAFLNQCRAVVLSMKAIRTVNPAARLLQTEDLGKTFSTPALADQAEFENTRRWLTFDLLGGRLDRHHPMWTFLTGAGVPERELGWFLDHPCPPDVMGINHYVTSERFLDERLDRYPGYAHVNNQGREYADMPAVRASAQGVSGPGRLLREAWERYGAPLAITEAQLNCTRDEQMRWFAEMWRDARALREREGVDVQAVTLWALLGAFNWINLLTRDDPNSYEAGAFDLRAGYPRRTALGTLAQTLGRDGDSDHPVLRVPGWWRRADRFVGEPAEAHQPLAPAVDRAPEGEKPERPLLVLGHDPELRQAFEGVCHERALPMRMVDGGMAQWLQALETIQPWAVICLPGVPGTTPADLRALAERCAASGAQFLAFAPERVVPVEKEEASGRSQNSSADFADLRRLGKGEEENAPSPLSGNLRQSVDDSSAPGQGPVSPVVPSLLLIRTGIRFGPWNEHDFILQTAADLSAGAPGLPAPGQPFTLTYLPDLAQTCLDLLLDGESGSWHLSNAGTLDRETFLHTTARLLATSAADDDFPVEPPAGNEKAATLSDRGFSEEVRSQRLPTWQSALRHLVDTRLRARGPR